VKETPDGRKSFPLLATDTSTSPPESDRDRGGGGARHASVVESWNVAGTTTEVPNLHRKSLESMKPVPKKVTIVPPLAGPAAGEMEDRVAAVSKE
jgi:hypothetical protein